jgi:ATP-dependent RNA helicase DDX18/HAS1
MLCRVQLSAGGTTTPAFHSQKSLEDLGLSKQLVEAVRSQGIESPSKIQAIAAYGLNTGHHCIVADQTGSGKTLAYLLPSLQRMLHARKQGVQSRTSSPYMVIMAPTTELAM